MFRLSLGALSRTQTQLIMQGLYLLIGMLLIFVGVECLDAEKIALRHHEAAASSVCTIK